MYDEFGKTAKVPSLWMYAENDQYWESEAPKGWHTVFAKGGCPTQLFTTVPMTGKDGHDLFFTGQELWLAHAIAFMKQLGYWLLSSQTGADKLSRHDQLSTFRRPLIVGR